MALVKPIARTKAAFDATKDETFYFNVEGGDLVVKNKITIVDQNTNQTVYTNTTPSSYFLYNQEVPRNTLTNGNYYYYYFNTFNSNNQMSVNSNSVPFYCYSDPIITFTNLPSQGEYITTSNFVFELSYSQAEDELMNYLIITIYDANHNIYLKSDKILSNQDNEYSWSVLGLTNGDYSISAECVTVNGTIINTDEFQFIVKTIVPKIYSRFTVNPLCDKGYVEVVSTLSDIQGTCSEDPIEYVSPSSIALLPRQEWVRWDDDFKIPSSFTLGVWGKIGENYQRKDNQEFRSEIVRLYNDNGDSIIVNISCEIPYGESDPKHCFEVNVFNGSSLVGWGRTNYIPLLNPNDDYVFMIQKNGTTWNLAAKNLTENTFDFVWNRVNEVHYGQTMATVLWNNSGYDTGSSATNNFSTVVDSIFPMTHVKLSNGVYDHIDISKNVTRTINDYLVPLEWDYDTVIDCNFEDNINAGNTDDIIVELGYIRVKRRAKGTSKWITIKEINTETEGTSFVYHDPCVPHGITQEYAIVPVTPSGMEGEYLITEVTPRWRYVFLTVDNQTIKVFAEVQYQNISNNRQYGTLLPLQSKYPIVIKNSATAYLSGSISALFTGQDYESHRQLDRQEVIKQVKTFQKLLDTGKTIIMKDWNGWIVIGRPTSGDTATFRSNWGNGVCSISYPFVEQGQYDNQEDLYALGLIDVNI